MLLAVSLAAAVLGLVVGFVLARARAGGELRAQGERLAAAQATLHAEASRRADLEGRLSAVERARADLDKQLAVARERVDTSAALIAEQQKFVADSKSQLESSFKALAATALRGNNEQFLQLAHERLGGLRTQAQADMDERKVAIETLLTPLKDTLGRLEVKTADLEQARASAYAKLEQQVASLAQTTSHLSDRTTSLVTALRGSSQARGQWGELVLRNVAEAAGMLEHCDFELQATQDDGKRPDMVVRLPGERLIAVDAKVPLGAYYEACEAPSEAARQEALLRHVVALKAHVKALKQRDYAGTLAADVDLVVLFLPGDPILSAAFNHDPDLQLDAFRAKVLIATPTTLLALLRTVAIYWQQRAVAENADAIAATARELYERAAKFGEDLDKVGKGLRQAVSAYNAAAGSFDARLVPLGKRLEDMKITEQSKREVAAPEVVELIPRDRRERLQTELFQPVSSKKSAL